MVNILFSELVTTYDFSLIQNASLFREFSVIWPLKIWQTKIVHQFNTYLTRFLEKKDMILTNYNLSTLATPF